MSYFKKFTDFAAGVAAFVAGLLFLRHYMEFTPPDTTEDAPGKLAQFLKNAGTTDYTLLLGLILLLLLSVVLGIVFRKLPHVCLGISVLPAIYIAFMFEKELLCEQEALFLAVAVLHILGNITECILQDKKDGRHRLFIASKIPSILGAILCFIVAELIRQPASKDPQDFNAFEKAVNVFATAEDASILMILGFMLLALFLIGILLQDVYFVDAILSFIPFGYAFFHLSVAKTEFAPFTVMCIPGICLLCNLMLAIFENNLTRKEQAEEKEQTQISESSEEPESPEQTEEQNEQ